ncbi:MAG: hypothetical protein HY046_10590 [Acidobacteria bacterium]|nr:hypothetical protein [Acidobacteriota bacterium]
MSIVIAYMDDIFFKAKLEETARHTGASLKFAMSAEELLALGTSHPEALVVVDLNATGDPVAAIQELRKADKQRNILGFFSHVQTELAERAKAAGCTQVMPRSKFTKHLAEILSASTT